MKLDVRLPMGLLFLILGVLLLVYGAASNPAIYARHHNIGLNINLICGIMFAVFGLLMLLLARRARKKD